jgi:subtilisin family serine protease
MVRPGRFSRLLVLCILIVVSPALLFAQDNVPPAGYPEGPFTPQNLLDPKKGEIIVQLAPGAWDRLFREFLFRHNGHAPSVSQLRSALAQKLGLRASSFVTQATLVVKGRRINVKKIARAQKNKLITTVENHFRVFAFGSSDDFLYKLGLLWGLNNTGGLFGGTPDVDVDAPEAWEITTGSSDLVVAVIDTGIAMRHPDLAASIWQNPNEIAGNGVDDDGNGYVDDVHGWNFIDNSPNPEDDQFHGTHCAGTIAAQRGNGRGIAGVAPSIKLLPIKILNAKGEGDGADLVKAIDYLIKLRQAGVNLRIMSASLGGGDDSPAISSIISRAGDAGILLVAAAGNDASDNDTQPVYPASYDLPNVLSVAALDSNGNLASFSNYGRRSVHVAAPGVNIWSSIIYNFYLPFSGTSMAAPFVSGVAALVASEHPSYSPRQLRSKIMESVKPLDGLDGKMQQPGIVSAYLAVS